MAVSGVREAARGWPPRLAPARSQPDALKLQGRRIRIRALPLAPPSAAVSLRAPQPRWPNPRSGTHSLRLFFSDLATRHQPRPPPAVTASKSAPTPREPPPPSAAAAVAASQATLPKRVAASPPVLANACPGDQQPAALLPPPLPASAPPPDPPATLSSKLGCASRLRRACNMQRSSQFHVRHPRPRTAPWLPAGCALWGGGEACTTPLRRPSRSPLALWPPTASTLQAGIS